MQDEYQGIGLAWAAETDVGRIRTLNEDSYLAEPPVFVVADGMGGHDAGEVASALTVERLAGFAGSLPPEIDSVAEEFQAIHGLLKGVSIGGHDVDMGTTAVALIVALHTGVPNWLVVNIGDSRAYCVSGGVMAQVTNDHSYVQELVDSGKIEASDARRHPQRNVVTQALGATDVARPDFWIRPIKSGERFLLCSDGLSSEVTDEEIEQILCVMDSPEATVERLKQRALDSGGHDNVTVVVVDVLSVPASIEESTETKPARNERLQVWVEPASPRTTEDAPAGSDLFDQPAIVRVPAELLPEPPENIDPGTDDPDTGLLIEDVPSSDGDIGVDGEVDMLFRGDPLEKSLIVGAPVGLEPDDGVDDHE